MLQQFNTKKAGPGLLVLFLFFSALAFVATAFSGCTPGAKSWQLSGPTMGTSYHITVVDVPGEVARAGLQQLIDTELQQVNQEMSTYIEDSELMRFNRGSVGEAVPASAHLAQVVALSLEINRRSGGAFDITVGPLVNLWGFGPDPDPEDLPSEADIQERLEQVGSDALLVELEPERITRSRPVQMDLSAIAKGHGVDRVALLLEGQGIRNYLVEIGGEVRTLGRNPRGEDWRIGVESPSPVGHSVQKPIVVSGKSIATSGDYRNYYERDGVRYSHTIDPRTGKPIHHKTASVTVIADNCAEADGWATAFNVMGTDEALKVAEREGIPVFLLVKNSDGFEERYSSAFAPYLETSGK